MSLSNIGDHKKSVAPKPQLGIPGLEWTLHWRVCTSSSLTSHPGHTASHPDCMVVHVCAQRPERWDSVHVPFHLLLQRQHSSYFYEITLLASCHIAQHYSKATVTSKASRFLSYTGCETCYEPALRKTGSFTKWVSPSPDLICQNIYMLNFPQGFLTGLWTSATGWCWWRSKPSPTL